MFIISSSFGRFWTEETGQNRFYPVFFHFVRKKQVLDGKNPTPLRCCWSIACRRCSNYIFILDLTPGFIGLDNDNCTTRRETFNFGDLVQLILEILRYLLLTFIIVQCNMDTYHDYNVIVTLKRRRREVMLALFLHHVSIAPCNTLHCMCKVCARLGS